MAEGVECTTSGSNITVRNVVGTVSPQGQGAQVALILLEGCRFSAIDGTSGIEVVNATLRATAGGVEWVVIANTILGPGTALGFENITAVVAPNSGGVVTGTTPAGFLEIRQSTLRGVALHVSNVTLSIVTSLQITAAAFIMITSGSSVHDLAFTCMSSRCLGPTTLVMFVLLVQGATLNSSTLWVDDATVVGVDASIVRFINTVFTDVGSLRRSTTTLFVRGATLTGEPDTGSVASFETSYLLAPVDVSILDTVVPDATSAVMFWYTPNAAPGWLRINVRASAGKSSLVAFDSSNLENVAVHIEDVNFFSESAVYVYGCVWRNVTLVVVRGARIAGIPDTSNAASFVVVVWQTALLQSSTIIVVLLSRGTCGLAYVTGASFADNSGLHIDCTMCVESQDAPPLMHMAPMMAVLSSTFVNASVVLVVPPAQPASSVASTSQSPSPCIRLQNLTLRHSMFAVRGPPRSQNTPAVVAWPGTVCSISLCRFVDGSVVALTNLAFTLVANTASSATFYPIWLSTCAFSNGSTLQLSGIATQVPAAAVMRANVLLAASIRHIQFTDRSRFSIDQFACAFDDTTATRDPNVTSLVCLHVLNGSFVGEGVGLSVRGLVTETATMGIYATELVLNHATADLLAQSVLRDIEVAVHLGDASIVRSAVLDVLSHTVLSVAGASCAYSFVKAAVHVRSSQWRNATMSLLANATVDAAACGYGVVATNVTAANVTWSVLDGGTVRDARCAVYLNASALLDVAVLVADATLVNTSAATITEMTRGQGRVSLELLRCRVQSTASAVSVSGSYENIAVRVVHSAMPSVGAVAWSNLASTGDAEILVVDTSTVQDEGGLAAAPEAAEPSGILLDNVSLTQCTLRIQNTTLGSSGNGLLPTSSIRLRGVRMVQPGGVLLLLLNSSTLRSEQSSIVVGGAWRGAVLVSVVATTLDVAARYGNGSSAVRIVQPDTPTAQLPSSVALVLDRAVVLGAAQVVTAEPASLLTPTGAVNVSVDVYCSWWGRRAGSATPALSVAQLRAASWVRPTFHASSPSDPSVVCAAAVLRKPMSGTATLSLSIHAASVSTTAVHAAGNVGSGDALRNAAGSLGAVVVFGSFSSVVSIGAFAAQRGQLLLSLCDGVDDVMLSPVDAMGHPLQFSLGPSFGAYVRGSVVGNLFGVYGGTAAACFIAVVGVAMTMQQSSDPAGAMPFLLRGAARLSLPGVWFAHVLPLLLEPLTMHGVALLLHGASARDVVLGLVVVIFACATTLFLGIVLVLRFCAVAVGARRLTPSDGRAKLRHALLGDAADAVTWVAAHGMPRGECFVKMHGAMFNGASRGRQWWFLCEVGLSVVFGVLGGILPSEGTTACTAISWTLLAVSIVFLVLAVVLRPYHRALDQGLLLSVTMLTVVCAAVDVSAFGSSDDGAATMYALNIAMNALTASALLVDLRVRVRSIVRTVSSSPNTLPQLDEAHDAMPPPSQANERRALCALTVPQLAAALRSAPHGEQRRALRQTMALQSLLAVICAADAGRAPQAPMTGSA